MRTKAPLARVVAAAKAAPPPRDFIGALKAGSVGGTRPGLIAEVKKASPSKGVIQPDFDPVRIASAYEAGGATCLSVLTDKKFFQGDFEFISQIRASGNALPILAKEFVVEAYQLYRARAAGADAVLLIAAVLDDDELRSFSELAESIGIDALVEVHDEAELDRALAVGASLVGVNQRDLVTFAVDTDRAVRVASHIPAGVVAVAESGVRDNDDAARLAAAGYDAILVGESLVTSIDRSQQVWSMVGYPIGGRG